MKRRLADTLDANATLDLHEYWYDYVVYSLAARIAESHGHDRKAAQLSGSAEAAFREGRREAGENQDTQAVIGGYGS